MRTSLREKLQKFAKFNNSLWNLENLQKVKKLKSNNEKLSTDNLQLTAKFDQTAQLLEDSKDNSNKLAAKVTDLECKLGNYIDPDSNQFQTLLRNSYILTWFCFENFTLFFKRNLYFTIISINTLQRQKTTQVELAFNQYKNRYIRLEFCFFFGWTN